MKRVNLIYWSGNNFGDELSPQLIHEISGLPVQYKTWDPSPFLRWKSVLSKICRFRLGELKSILWPSESSVVGVGSVIRWGNERSLIWGSGFMNEDDPFRGGQTFAVRGALTNQKLQKMGFPACHIYGDPAVLLPLWIQPRVAKKHKLGIIPHWKEVDFFIDNYSDKYHIIDLRTNDVKSVVEEICMCEHVLSTSLHGLIVAHAYHIPALWLKKGYIDTDGFKFKDYFSSVNITAYEGFSDYEQLLDIGTWQQLFHDYSNLSVAQIELENMQKDLLKKAPFPLKDKYKAFIRE